MSLANLKTKVTESTVVGKAENFLEVNGPTVSMFAALVTLGITLYQAFKASDKVAQIKSDYEEKVQEIENEPLPALPDGVAVCEGSKDAEILEAEIEKAMVSKQERIKEQKTYRNMLLILAYKWVIAGGTLATFFMFLCNYLHGRQLMTAMGALALSKDKIKNLTQSAKEVLPEEKVKELEDKSLEKLVSKNFYDEKNGPIIVRPDTSTVGVGDIYVCGYSGTQFQFRGTEKELLEIFDRATDYCYRCHGLPVSKFYSMLGIPTPPWAWGTWGPNLPFKAHIEKREICGAVFKVIVYDYDPGTLAEAGCPSK